MRYFFLFTLYSFLFCSQATAKLFLTQHQELYRKNTLIYLTQINTNKNKLVDIAKELKKKYPHPKDQFLLDHYIKHQKPQTKLIMNKDWIDIKINGRQMGKITGINGDTNSLFINNVLISFSEPLLVKNIEWIEKSLTKRKHNAWSPINTFVPKAYAFPVAMLALAIHLTTQKLPGVARANQPTQKPVEVCPNMGGDPKNFLTGRYNSNGEPYNPLHKEALEVMYSDSSKIKSTTDCTRVKHEYYSLYKEDWNIKPDRKPILQEICYMNFKLKSLCKTGSEESPDESEAIPAGAPSSPRSVNPVPSES